MNLTSETEKEREKFEQGFWGHIRTGTSRHEAGVPTVHRNGWRLFIISARNGNLEAPAYFLKVKQGYTV
jgi:hypothetical protein